MKPNKTISLLGIATKAGRLVSGEFMTEKTVKDGRAALVVVAEDASDNTKKMFQNMCEFYEVPFCIWGTKEQIGHAIGKEYRASCAITDEGFRDAFLKQIQAVRREEE